MYPLPGSKRARSRRAKLVAMRRSLLFAALALASPALSHDLFLELASHSLEPGTETSVALVNGTFGESDNVITRDRMLDVSIVGPANKRHRPPSTAWRDEGTTSWLDFETGESGTYVLSVSTAPRVIELAAEDFNDYLEHDGVLDVLEARTRAGELEEAAKERYSKHVKAIVQVGEPRSGAWSEAVGYPIEIVPLANPADLHEGGRLPLQVLLDGAPLVSQLVYASHAAHHAHDASGGHVEAFSGRTDEEGRVTVPVDEAGRWYVRLIHMEPSAEADVDYESLWATLTFEVAEAGARSTFPTTVALAAALAAVLVVLLWIARPGPKSMGPDAA